MKLKFAATFWRECNYSFGLFNGSSRGADSLQRNAQLQADLTQFPLLTFVTNSDGQPIFQTLALKNPVVIDGKKYFWFQVFPSSAAQKTGRDFVWAFCPAGGHFFLVYFAPNWGTMDGFQGYCYCPRDIYPTADALLPLNGRRVILQSLSGDALDDGQTYLIWFSFEKNNPAGISLTFTFANLRNEWTQCHQWTQCRRQSACSG